MKRFIRDVIGWLILLAAVLTIYHFLSSPQETPDGEAYAYTSDGKVPTGLYPAVEDKTNELIQRAENRGITMFITDDFRSSADQDELYAQGRTSGGSIVTNARGGESYHNYGLAVDFALKNSQGEAIWDMNYDGNGNGKADWMEVVDLAKELGFEWGGDWPGFKDYPHLQMDFGLTISQLKEGYMPK
ncbi:M15 family metallopeptidase [Aciduricibacillus chroicocephali]|uniref:M15 family metallopeptidase n=1 Tax=Aciduricibacillus chroicocephali TaxID=3054939 RepID=A0ABY9KW72_9BACI|nr:M15 family metallopeptidase [Bacillaceae bacterium 44XB]